MEEIIIDGVNVAGCKYYKGKCMEYTHYCQIGCKECTDIGIKLCHYKQTEIFKAKIERLEQENAELKAENERLKEEIEIRDNLSEKFRKEALSWANIANEYQKDKTKLKQTLQEIKKIAEIAFAVCDDDCGNANRFTEILDLITKAEEE